MISTQPLEIVKSIFKESEVYLAAYEIISQATAPQPHPLLTLPLSSPTPPPPHSLHISSKATRTTTLDSGTNQGWCRRHQVPSTERRHRACLDFLLSGSVDEALDRNLDDMASGLARLKGLAQGLNSELSEHNQILDR